MATKDVPTLGTEINKHLKALVVSIIEDDEEIRQQVKGMVLEYLHANPATIQRVVANTVNQILTRPSWVTDSKDLSNEVKDAVGEVMQILTSRATAAAQAALAAELTKLKGA